MTLEKLSKKQRLVLKWAHMPSTANRYRSIICDGAVRSGKTVAMTIGFIHWAMRCFEGASFAICGKTVSSVERNIITPLLDCEDVTAYYDLHYSPSKAVLNISVCGKQTRFYLFGGKDESSYMLIQGITLCGVLFDEVALMPQSFVDQAIARTLSVSESKLWFNCNPDNPNHWFYKNWILDAEGENKKHSLHLHFDMTDNPLLTKADIERATAMYDGAFLKRYIYGEWVAADGLVYPQFDEKENVTDESPNGEYYVSVDYGTHNPCSMGLWSVSGGKAYRIDEAYYDSVRERRQLTDEEYYEMLQNLCGNRQIRSVIIDPSAASIITLVRRKGKYNVDAARNDVIDGLRFTGTLIKSRKIMINRKCADILREFSLYRWDEKAADDRVIKENDHAMDDMRYFCSTVLRHNSEFSGGDFTVESYDYCYDDDY